jgi:hypothetical protein
MNKKIHLLGKEPINTTFYYPETLCGIDIFYNENIRTTSTLAECTCKKCLKSNSRRL